MTVADLENIGRQAPMTPSLAKAIEFLRTSKLQDLPDGRVEIDGDRVFAVVQRYETGADGPPVFEAHKKYIDVQYLASGEEIIGWVPLGEMTVTRAYDAGKDICFGTAREGRWTPVHLHAGRLAMLWPEDAHAPRLASAASSFVMKVVVKVAVWAPSPGFRSGPLSREKTGGKW
jgi:biofilm protein TabA